MVKSKNFLLLYQIPNKMRILKLTAVLFVLLIFAGCLKNDFTIYVKNGLPVTAAQGIPSLPTGGSGTVDISYNPYSKILDYTLKWSNLTDSVIAVRICGPAPAGYNSPNLTFNPAPASLLSPSTTPHNVLQEFVGTSTKALYAKSGSYSGSLLVDGVKIKEEELLNNSYYFTIHTKTITPGSPPASLVYRWFGEIRGQIIVL